MIAGVDTHTEYGGRRVYRVVGRRGNWLGVLAAELPAGRTGWIAADHAVLGSTRVRITIDRSARRLTVRRSGRVVERMLVTVGAPSSPTPLGRFAVTDKLWMERGSIYGCCALALSVRQTRGALAGGRVAIHGTRFPEALGRAASNGCAPRDGTGPAAADAHGAAGDAGSGRALSSSLPRCSSRRLRTPRPPPRAPRTPPARTSAQPAQRASSAATTGAVAS